MRDAHQRFDEFGIAYDPNGNIQTLSRNAWQAPVMDSPQIDALTYEYYPKTNQLRRIRDAVSHPLQGKGTGKFGDLTTQPDTNYVYDALGRLVIDKSENYRIVYDAYDNVKEVRTLDADKLIVSFRYDDGNYRVRKTSYNEDGSVERHTYYFRDNKGNTMGVYDQTASGPLTLKEHTLYSNDRFGTLFRAENRYAYELKDHLGNVRAVINRRVVNETNPPADPGPALAYLADYYPFGWLMPDRKVLEYRYGYNDQETDPETGWATFKFRAYDGRLARFFRVDPLAKSYPHLTPYQFSSNNPVQNKELEGAEGNNATVNLKIPSSPLEVNTSVWTPLKANEGIERGHLLRWFNKETGLTLAFDGPTPGKDGWKAKPHWHVYNKDGLRLSKTGAIAGKDGIIKSNKGAPNGHLLPGEITEIQVSKPPLQLTEPPKAKPTEPTLKSRISTTKLAASAGKVVLVVGAASSVYNVAVSDNKARAVVKEIGGWAAAGETATIGAALGAPLGPIGSFVGALVLGGVGYYYGSDWAGRTYDSFNR